MSALLSPQTRPAKILAPGLLAVILGSVVLALMRAAYLEVPQEFSGLPTSAFLVLFGIIGAFGAFLTVLTNSVLVWIYGRALQYVNAGFVRTFVVVTCAYAVVYVAQAALCAAELAVSGEVAAAPLTNLSRYLGPGSVQFDLLNLVSVAVMFLGARRYLGYGRVSAGVLAALTLVAHVLNGFFA